MSAPEPGCMPMMVPKALPRKRAHGYFFNKPHMPAKMLPIFSVAIIGGGSILVM